jgi:hypothetical protein
MESITTFFRVENDPLFRRGEARGEQNKAIAVAIELKKERFPIEQIAKFTALSIEEIETL